MKGYFGPPFMVMLMGQSQFKSPKEASKVYRTEINILEPRFFEAVTSIYPLHYFRQIIVRYILNTAMGNRPNCLILC